jgi:hypothetical protein
MAKKLRMFFLALIIAPFVLMYFDNEGYYITDIDKQTTTATYSYHTHTDSDKSCYNCKPVSFDVVYTYIDYKVDGISYRQYMKQDNFIDKMVRNQVVSNDGKFQIFYNVKNPKRYYFNDQTYIYNETLSHKIGSSTAIFTPFIFFIFLATFAF